MKLYIKNMVCNRCIAAVNNEFEKLNIRPLYVQLGEVNLNDEPDDEQIMKLRNGLSLLGFELLDNHRTQLIEKIKNAVVEYVHYNNSDDRRKFSGILSKKLAKDYSYLSRLFSEVEGITIEKYVINQKIEKVKELLVYDELSLGEIAFQLGYSSLAHLSAQFKKATGFTPGQFKNMGARHRKSLDKI